MCCPMCWNLGTSGLNLGELVSLTSCAVLYCNIRLSILPILLGPWWPLSPEARQAYPRLRTRTFYVSRCMPVENFSHFTTKYFSCLFSLGKVVDENFLTTKISQSTVLVLCHVQISNLIQALQVK